MLEMSLPEPVPDAQLPDWARPKTARDATSQVCLTSKPIDVPSGFINSRDIDLTAQWNQAMPNLNF